MSQTIKEIEDEIVEEFELFDERDDKISYLIDEAKKLPPFDPKYRIDSFLIRGCQSKVWLLCYMDKDVMVIEIDSNAFVTKGIAALIWRVLNRQKPKDILDSNLDFINRTNLRSFLVSQRSDGLSAMVAKIKHYATVLQ